MGSVANKIAKMLKSSRKSKVVDLAAWRQGRELALETGLVGDVQALSKRFADHDPCHAIYAVGQNFASVVTELISGLREAKGYVRIVGDAKEEYMPGYPPMSPLTTSYFTMWAMFDVRFGSSQETMGTCILRIVPECDGLSWVTGIVELMQQSRMGFYVHCGIKGQCGSAARGRHTGSHVLPVSSRLSRPQRPDLVRAGASSTRPFLPPAHRVQHALRDPGLSRTCLYRLSETRVRTDEGREEIAQGRRRTPSPDEIRSGSQPLERIHLLRLFESST